MTTLSAHCLFPRSLALSTDTTNDAASIEECGELGVMPLPAGADPFPYHRYLHHPLHGRKIQPGNKTLPAGRVPAKDDLVSGKALPAPLEEITDAISGL